MNEQNTGTQATGDTEVKPDVVELVPPVVLTSEHRFVALIMYDPKLDEKELEIVPTKARPLPSDDGGGERDEALAAKRLEKRVEAFGPAGQHGEVTDTGRRLFWNREVDLTNVIAEAEAAGYILYDVHREYPTIKSGKRKGQKRETLFSRFEPMAEGVTPVSNELRMVLEPRTRACTYVTTAFDNPVLPELGGGRNVTINPMQLVNKDAQKLQIKNETPAAPASEGDETATKAE